MEEKIFEINNQKTNSTVTLKLSISSIPTQSNIIEYISTNDHVIIGFKYIQKMIIECGVNKYMNIYFDNDNLSFNFDSDEKDQIEELFNNLKPYINFQNKLKKNKQTQF